MVFVDIETGGLDHTRHPIIQMAAVAWTPESGKSEEWERKVQFMEESCDPQALEANCYDKAVWTDNAIKLWQALEEFAEVLKAYRCVPKVSKAGKPYTVAQIVAHNAEFEANFLIEAYRRHSIFMPADYRFMCTKQAAMWTCRASHKMPEPKSYQLSDLHESFFGERVDEHDALADAKACMRVYQRLVELNG